MAELRMQLPVLSLQAEAKDLRSFFASFMENQVCLRKLLYCPSERLTDTKKFPCSRYVLAFHVLHVECLFSSSGNEQTHNALCSLENLGNTKQ